MEKVEYKNLELLKLFPLNGGIIRILFISLFQTFSNFLYIKNKGSFIATRDEG